MSESTIISDIRRLWEIATPVAVIARKLHLPVASVRAAIETGRLPQSQPQWTQQSIDFEA